MHKNLVQNYANMFKIVGSVDISVTGSNFIVIAPKKGKFIITMKV